VITSIVLSLSLGFDTATAVDASEAAMREILEVLVRHDLAYLREHKGTPPLYRAGIRYQRETGGREVWQDVPAILAARAGDCEDLAAWRAAELRMAGEKARATIRRAARPEGRRGYHAIVVRADGSTEDPSYQLGMGWEVEFARARYRT
jgi:hypothetical protein